MAQKAGARKKPEATDKGADDLQTLHPERSATIAGRQVTVREYGFIEGLGLRPKAQPLLDDLYAQIAEGHIPELEEILVLLGQHHLLIQELVAVAADVEPQWVASLNQDQGYQLLMMWWGANGPFYVRSAFNRVVAKKSAAAARAGLTSTPLSPPPVMEHPSTSDE